MSEPVSAYGREPDPGAPIERRLAALIRERDLAVMAMRRSAVLAGALQVEFAAALKGHDITPGVYLDVIMPRATEAAEHVYRHVEGLEAQVLHLTDSYRGIEEILIAERARTASDDRRRADAAEAEVARLRQTLDALTGSRTWRALAPVRRLASAARERVAARRR